MSEADSKMNKQKNVCNIHYKIQRNSLRANSDLWILKKSINTK